MVAKRIIPCLDIDNNRTVKGVNFKNLVDAGDPIELARIYSEKGADELICAFFRINSSTVSYTHLTLPTKRIV